MQELGQDNQHMKSVSIREMGQDLRREARGLLTSWPSRRTPSNAPHDAHCKPKECADNLGPLQKKTFTKHDSLFREVEDKPAWPSSSAAM